MTRQFEEEDTSLILAAEECEPEQFDALHTFSSRQDENIIRKLMAHGPVLLRGGRGSGKSAFLMAAARRLYPHNPDGVACGIYMSLRYLTLLRSTEEAYEHAFCELLAGKIRGTLGSAAKDFDPDAKADSLQRYLVELSAQLGMRIVLIFDDAAHIGREASLAEFFDIFRTLSSSTVSCKAAIYPGVTRFGNRFDVYNDATVIDVMRNEDLPGFREFFTEVLRTRFPAMAEEARFARGSELDVEKVAAFLGQAVLGNMRAFVFACDNLKKIIGESSVGLSNLGEALLHLASNHYWPLIEELQPKLGVYKPMVEPAERVAQLLFKECAEGESTSALVYREIVERLAKPFEILEYAGFVSRREVSRSMKSGGRGARFALNLCNLLEQTPGTRLTAEIFRRWTETRTEPLQFHRGSEFARIQLPEPPQDAELDILQMPIDALQTSQAYPNGLTEHMIQGLKQHGFRTVGELAQATDEELDAVPYIGAAKVRRIRNVVGQAIWM